MPLKFNASSGHTLGIELEVGLVDPRSMALKNSSGKIVAAAESDPLLKGYVKHELMRSNLEVITDICTSVEDAEDELSKKLKRVIEVAEDNDTLIMSAGTHPFSLASEQEITDDPRYKRLLENLQFVARRFNIFGLHVHVGMNDGEKCIYAMNRLLYWLPHLLALSANSPFWEGEDTGLKSYRTKVFETLPIAGLPFYFHHWDDYAKLVGNYLKTGTIETIRELWWDVRAHPDFGTIEVRICDIPSTLKETLAITALIQALVKKFSDDFDKGLPYLRPHSYVIRENKWRACRYGFDGDFINKDSETTQGARDMLKGLARAMEPEARSLGSEGYLKEVYRMLESGGGAGRQISLYKEGGSLEVVVEGLAKLLKEEVFSIADKGAGAGGKKA